MKKPKYRLLSYQLSEEAYTYGGIRPFSIKRLRSILKGDICNTYMMNMPTHMGTHIDCPNHFFNSGKKLSQYNIGDFIFSNPAVIDCPKKRNELVVADDIKRNLKKIIGKDILLLRTGFYKFRPHIRYARENPGIEPGAARFIRERLISLKCIGIDTISVSPYSNRELGRRTHKILLQDYSFNGQPVRIIEDMDLSGNLKNINKVFVVLLFIESVDSAPCAVLAF
jgi:kynurenine formamidase